MRLIGRMTHMTDTTQPIVQFLERVIAAFGIKRTRDARRDSRRPAPELSRATRPELLVRHRGEPLKALQHGRGQRVRTGVPATSAACSWMRLGYRKGKDSELRQMAKLLAEEGEAVGRPISNSDRSTPTNAASCTWPLPRFPASPRRASATRSRKRSSSRYGSSRS